MNYWAILEYQLCYKNEKKGAERIRKELKECAIDIAKIDKKMLKVAKRDWKKFKACLKNTFCKRVKEKRYLQCYEKIIIKRYPFSAKVSIYLSHILRYNICRMWEFFEPHLL